MDLQLIAAAVVVNVVVFIICYVYYGSRRELSFEEALAELEGLNILLSKNSGAGDKKSHQQQQKEAAKKKKLAAAAAAAAATSTKKNVKKKTKVEDRQHHQNVVTKPIADIVAKKSGTKEETIVAADSAELRSSRKKYPSHSEESSSFGGGDLPSGSGEQLLIRKAVDVSGSSSSSRRNRKEQHAEKDKTVGGSNKFEYLTDTNIGETVVMNNAQPRRITVLRNDTKSADVSLHVEARAKILQAQNLEQTHLNTVYNDFSKKTTETLTAAEEMHPQDPSDGEPQISSSYGNKDIPATVTVVESTESNDIVVASASAITPEANTTTDLAPKKKKSKSSKSIGGKRTTSTAEKTAEILQTVPANGYDTVDARLASSFNEDSLPNSVLRRLSLPPLTEAQQEIVADFYCNPNSHGYSSGLAMANQKLRKELDESNLNLSQTGQKLTVALQSLKDLNQEVINEKQRYSMMESSTKDQLTLKQNENQNLSQKIREFQAQMTSKMQAYRQMEAQVLQCRIEQGGGAQAQQLREENQRIKERISNLEQEIHARNSDSQRLKQELMSRDNQIHRLEQQRQEMEQRRAIQEANFNQQFKDNQSKLMQKEQECNQLEKELKVLQEEISLLQQDHKLLRQQLTEKETRVQTLSQQSVIDSETKKEIDRIRAEFFELKETYQKELAKQKVLKDDLESDFSKRLRHTEDQCNRTTEQKDLEIIALKKELDSINQDNIRNDGLRHKELENAFNAINKLDAEIIQLKNELNSASAKLQERENVVRELQNELDNAKSTREKSETENRDELQPSLVNGTSQPMENGDYSKPTNYSEPDGVVLPSSNQKESKDNVSGVIVDHDSDKEMVRQVLLEWRGHPNTKDVMIMGSFNEWSRPTLLTPDPGDPCRFRADLHLPPGRCEFKFIVDGVWLCSERYEKCQSGNSENNVIHV